MQKKNFFEKICPTFKSTTISRTFECTTNSCTVDVKAQYKIKEYLRIEADEV